MMNDQRTKVFLDRYALKASDGLTPIEREPSEMYKRVADAIGTTPEERSRFLELLTDWRFVPGGRILSGAGTGTEVTYYNCYVIPIETKARRENRKPAAVEASYGPELLEQSFRIPPIQNDPGSDSREAILDTISVMVDIMSRGGGVGINWSVLRPKGSHLKRVNGTTSGPVSWMDVASHAVNTVQQGGSRRGAAMFMLDDWHPDILEFIDAKRNLDKITGANVSVAVSDRFMEAVRTDGDWDLVFPDTASPDYNRLWTGDLADWTSQGLPVLVHGTVRARGLWQRIAESAWHNGEPGVVFLERYNAESTGRGVERIICVNPCGEQGLGPYSVCNLGSMNLDAYIVAKKRYAPKGTTYSFNWEAFMKDAEVATRFLDNVIDSNFYFLPENEEAQKQLRRIGLGVMGLADALLALGLRYGSPAAVEFTDKVFHSLKVAAVRSSVTMAIEKGPAPAWDLAETWKRPYFAEFIQNDSPVGQQIMRYGLRNMFLLTQAPTGSTSILAGVNSGIEPYFAFEYTRVDRTGTHKVLASAVEKYKDEAVRAGPEWVTSQDVTVEGHIAMQSAVQRNVDSSVSKTLNAPNEHTVEDTMRAYQLAYDSGLKGLAYFRDGNGREQVLYKETPNDSKPVPDERDAELAVLRAEVDYLQGVFNELVPELVEFTRPDVLVGTTTKVTTRAGSAYVTVNRDESSGRPVEVFFNVGKAGSDIAAMAEALGRLASLALRKGATLGGVANQLEGVGGSGNFGKAIPHAIAGALTQANRQYPDRVQTPSPRPDDGDEEAEPDERVPEAGSAPSRYDICPDCHNASLSWQEGCSKCVACGYSAC